MVAFLRTYLIPSAVLLAAWVALAAWQGAEYRHECDTARETLRRQAESVNNALVSAMLSHRRLGLFFEEQIQGVLDELVKSKDVLAVGVAAADGRMLLSAGDRDLLGSPESVAGDSWSPRGFRLATPFRLLPAVVGEGPGMGMGGGAGGGRGWGRGRQRAESDGSGPFAPGGEYLAVLVLSRDRADDHCRHAAWSRASVVVAGSLALLCVAVIWQVTVRLADARGRARVLESESRHLRELSQAAAGLAHETRNPLSLIRGWTQRLMDSAHSDREHREQARAVIEECDRVTARINQFLAFARTSDPRPEPVDVARLVEELAALVEPDLDAKRLRLARAVPQEVTILADREMLRQSLFNLIQNAIQWSPEGGTVEIAMRADSPDRWRVEVIDMGPGVASEAASQLFTPYFATRPGGTGLGLAIVRRIAARHGWAAGYAPRPGGGSIFWLDGIHG